MDDTLKTAEDPIDLLHPVDGLADLLTTPAQLESLAGQLASSHGPVAFDAERASGFRYSQRAYLVQLRRSGAGTSLIDPIELPDLTAVNSALADAEWILHAADQDLACLAELGLKPASLFDTALAARLAGLPRVGLGPLVEDLLGFHLAKGHGAADWSKRPLPASWLNYAALDVELLIELREKLTDILTEQGKWEWAQQEFSEVLTATEPAARVDPWRRTSGIHRIADRQQLAVIRQLWLERDRSAAQRDIAPHRILPDSAIVAAAQIMPKTVAELTKLPVFGGPRQRRHARHWLAAIAEARSLPSDELPPVRLSGDGPPPVNRWARLNPDAQARRQIAQDGLTQLSEHFTVPVENLMTPRILRSALWEPPTTDDLPSWLAEHGTRPWQIALVMPVLIAAISGREFTL